MPLYGCRPRIPWGQTNYRNRGSGSRGCYAKHMYGLYYNVCVSSICDVLSVQHIPVVSNKRTTTTALSLSLFVFFLLLPPAIYQFLSTPLKRRKTMCVRFFSFVQRSCALYFLNASRSRSSFCVVVARILALCLVAEARWS